MPVTEFDPSRVKAGAGTLYAAPLGSVEPTSVTGAWDAAWQPLGYTEAGSEFDFSVTTSPMLVEEEFWPIRIITTGYAGKLSFAMAEQTRQNLAIALNAGIGSGVNAASQTAPSAGTIGQETPEAYTEVRIMLGWDALPKGAATGADPAARLVVRQGFQTGTLKRLHRKGNNKSTLAVEFSFEKPAAKQPFIWLMPSNLAV